MQPSPLVDAQRRQVVCPQMLLNAAKCFAAGKANSLVAGHVTCHRGNRQVPRGEKQECNDLVANCRENTCNAKIVIAVVVSQQAAKKERRGDTQKIKKQLSNL